MLNQAQTRAIKRMIQGRNMQLRVKRSLIIDSSRPFRHSKLKLIKKTGIGFQSMKKVGIWIPKRLSLMLAT